jgi:phospholipid transport system substrate-binding protein
MIGGARLLGMALAMATLAFSLAGAPVRAAAAGDPAAAQIEAFDASLLEVMKAGKALGVHGRFARLEPVVERTFDIPTMTRIAVGADWPSIAPAKQQALIDAFGRLTTAGYAHNFSGWSGERFQLDPNVITRGPDKLVQTQIVPASGAPTAIGYRMRQSGGTWKVIDVLYGAISQLTTRRSDFASTLDHGGPDALLAHLNALVDKDMK